MDEDAGELRDAEDVEDSGEVRGASVSEVVKLTDTGLNDLELDDGPASNDFNGVENVEDRDSDWSADEELFRESSEEVLFATFLADEVDVRSGLEVLES